MGWAGTLPLIFKSGTPNRVVLPSRHTALPTLPDMFHSSININYPNHYQP